MGVRLAEDVEIAGRLRIEKTQKQTHYLMRDGGFQSSDFTKRSQIPQQRRHVFLEAVCKDATIST
jgi:hypothetical protein